MGKRLTMRAGQVARFGRSDWADFAFHDDPVMAEVQFEIYCDDQACTLVTLVSEPPTLVNGQVVGNVRLRSGDRIQAGQSELALEIEGAVASAHTELLSAAAALPLARADETAELCRFLELSALAQEMAATHTEVVTFEHRLIEAGLLKDAIRWRAHRLPKSLAVQWALDCLDSAGATGLDDVQRNAVITAAKWAAEPTEEHRLASLQQLVATDTSGLGGALSGAVAWSGGSLAPEGADPIAPDERLTGHCVTIAIHMVSHMARSTQPIEERLRKYLKIEPQAKK